MFGNKKQTLLEKAIAGRPVNKKLYNRIEKLPDNYEVGTASDMHVIGEVLSTVESMPEDFSDESDSLHSLVALCQQLSTREARDAFSEAVAPELVRLYDNAIKQPEINSSMAMFMLKQLANFPSEGSADRLAHAAHHPELEDEYLWEVIGSILSHPDNPAGLEMARKISKPLPRKFAAVALLDCMNAIALDDRLDEHPFDSEEGVKRLEHWLSDSDPENFSYAVSATATLPFITGPEQNRLLELALKHPDSGVNIEAAWAAAKTGQTQGIDRLVEASADPHLSTKAVSYLEELGFGDAVPDSVRDPGFAAMAEMSQWLQHPMEFGRTPEELVLYDHRTLYWPPTKQSVPLWLFKYRYTDEDPEEEDEVGIGMVGSVTFALFGEATEDLSPEEIYGLHCFWELQNQNHPDAPSDRDGKKGWAVIQAAQPN